MAKRVASLVFLGLFITGAALAQIPDRVGLPTDVKTFAIVRTFFSEKEQLWGTVFANPAAASIQESGQRPYPFGSVFVVEWRSGAKDAAGKPVPDPEKGTVARIDVMRREKGFGESYGESRAGEWEFAQYLADGSPRMAPERTSSCAACHRKAGAERDFVYRGRFPASAP